MLMHWLKKAHSIAFMKVDQITFLSLDQNVLHVSAYLLASSALL